jgi:hypothetical protein
LRRCYRGDLPARLFIPGALRISRGSVQVFMALSYTYRATRDGCEAHYLTSGWRGALDDHSATLPGPSGRTELAPKPSPILGLTARTNLLIGSCPRICPTKRGRKARSFYSRRRASRLRTPAAACRELCCNRVWRDRAGINELPLESLPLLAFGRQEEAKRWTTIKMAASTA